MKTCPMNGQTAGTLVKCVKEQSTFKHTLLSYFVIDQAWTSRDQIPFLNLRSVSGSPDEYVFNQHVIREVDRMVLDTNRMLTWQNDYVRSTCTWHHAFWPPGG